MQKIDEALGAVHDALNTLEQAREDYLNVAVYAGAEAGEDQLDACDEARAFFLESCKEFHAAITDLGVAARSVRADAERAAKAYMTP